MAGDTTVGYSPFLEDGSIDVVFQGDEYTVAKSIEALANGIPRDQIEGVVHMSGGAIKHNRPARPIRALDELPHSTLYIADKIDQLKEKGLDYLPYLRATRGCYAACSFCHEAVPHFEDLEVRHRHVSLGWLRKSLRRVVSRGATEIMFQDSNFLPHPRRGDAWVSEFTTLMRADFPKVTFAFWTRAQDLAPERIKMLRDTNLAYVLIGVESLINSRLKRLRKGLNAKQIRSGIRLLQEAGIEGKLSFILFDPETTISELRSEVAEMARLFSECPDVQRNPIFAWNILTPHPDTPLYSRLQGKGLLHDQITWGIEEQVSYMSSRLVGSPGLIAPVRDGLVGVVCEAFRLYQYEYARKWHAFSRAVRDGDGQGTFNRHLPLRMVGVLKQLVEIAYSNQSFIIRRRSITASTYHLTCDI